MKQTTLFETFDEQQVTKPAARRTDPPTSHVAARSYESSGNADSDRAAIKQVIYRDNIGPDGFPLHGWTGGEIARALGDGWDNVRVIRRTSELERSCDIRRGPARKCTAKGSEMLTFHRAE